MSSNDQLFYEGQLNSLLEHLTRNLGDQVNGLSPTQLLPADDAQVRDHFVGKFKMEPIELKEEEMELIEPREVKVEARDYDFGRRYQKTVLEFRFEIPFIGNAGLFKLRPSTFTTPAPRGRVEGTCLVYIHQRDDRNKEALQSEVKRFIANVQQHLFWQRTDIDNWNNSLQGLVQQLVTSRREKLEADKQMVDDLGFRVRRRGDSPVAQTVPITRKTVIPSLPPSKSGPLATQDPTIEMSVYEEILETLASMSVVMERSPSAFANSDEEALRTQFLIPLNNSFKGDATGETFNMSGKTDILIKHKDRVLFVAECKFWRGPQSLSDTIDQLLSYLTWRETKAAILLFNRNKDFSAVLAQIPGVFKVHPQFVRQEGYAKTTGFRFIVRHPNDPNRTLLVTLLAFDVPMP